MPLRPFRSSRRRLLPACVVAALFAPLCAPAAQPAAAAAARTSKSASGASAASPGFSAFVDGYLRDFTRRHPSIAAGNGLHDADATLDDFSAAAIAREIAELKRDRDRLRAFASATLTPDERADAKILEGVIDGWLLEQETLQNWRRNPMLYASALSDGVHNLMTVESDPPALRMRRIIAKLGQVPALLAAARTNVVNPPRLFAERGATFMRGASEMLGKDLDLAFAGAGTAALRDSLRRAADRAIPLIDAYVEYLEKEVVPHATGDYAIGGANVARRYRDEELIDEPLSALVALGERE